MKKLYNLKRGSYRDNGFTLLSYNMKAYNLSPDKEITHMLLEMVSNPDHMIWLYIQDRIAEFENEYPHLQVYFAGRCGGHMVLKETKGLEDQTKAGYFEGSVLRDFRNLALDIQKTAVYYAEEYYWDINLIQLKTEDKLIGYIRLEDENLVINGEHFFFVPIEARKEPEKLKKLLIENKILEKASLGMAFQNETENLLVNFTKIL